MTSTAVKYITLLSEAYVNRVLATGPVALWPLSETSGTTATDVVGGRNGTYANVTLNSTTFGDGTAAPLFNGITGAAGSYITLPVVSLTTVFTPAAFTFAAWFKVSSAAVWSDSTFQVLLQIGADTSNRYFVAIPNTPNNTIRLYGSQGGSSSSADVQTAGTTAWAFVVATNNVTANQRTAWVNNTAGTPQSSSGTYAGNLAVAVTGLGSAAGNTASTPWSGWLKYATLWNRVLTPTEVASLYVSGFAV